MAQIAKIVNDTLIAYPVSEFLIRQEYPNVSFPNPIQLPFGSYIRVESTTKPEIDPQFQKLIEGTPVKDGDVWRQVWEIAEHDLPSEADLLTRLDAQYEDIRQSSFAFDFGDTDAIDDSGNITEAGIKNIQMRDTALNPDQSNWNKLVGILTIAVMNGLPSSTVSQIRVEENVNVQTTVAQFFTAISAAAFRNQKYLFYSIYIKSQIRSATTLQDKYTIYQDIDWASALV